VDTARWKVIECPYYKREVGNSIRCEGYEDGINLQLNFASQDRLREHRGSFCSSDCWRGCVIAQLAGEKYGDKRTDTAT